MIIVFPSKNSDATDLQAIYALCIGSADWLPEAARQSPVLEKVSSGEMIHVAKTETGTLVGFVSVHSPESFVHHLYVHPDFRGQGVGSLLLKSLDSRLPQPWRLKCVRKNGAALNFYARNGWREVGSGESEDGAYAVLLFELNR